MDPGIIYTDLTNDISFDFLPYDTPIRVYFLEAPLGFLENISILSAAGHPVLNINGYHSGIGFVCGDISFYFDYMADAGIGGTLLPLVDDCSNITWNNKTKITIGSMNTDYWTRSSYLTSITREQFMSLKDWSINVYLPISPMYVLFGIVKDSTPESIFNPIKRGSTCYNYAYGIINMLQNHLGVKINYMTKPAYDATLIIPDGELTILNISNVVDKIAIVKFYKDTQDFMVECSALATDIKKQIDKSSYDLATVMKLGYDLMTKVYARWLTLKQNTFIYYTYDAKNIPQYYAFSIKTINITYVSYPLVNAREKFSLSTMLAMKATPDRTKYILLSILGVFMLVLLIYILNRNFVISYR